MNKYMYCKKLSYRLYRIKKKTLPGAIVFLFASLIGLSSAFAQGEENPIRIFGYFQNSLQQWTAFENRPEQNSFSVQQLNLFFQKDLSPNWSAFVNFEFLNNFSSSRQWGAANLEEAWIKYRADMRFNLKLGLQIPIFNNLNEIKNRTPLLAYIIRPLAYETSFSEFIPVDILTPERAFAQVYGFFPNGETKIDYAVYIGNSPNIRSTLLEEQSGVDTTSTFLVGGRLGFRHRELKIGFSATYDRDNIFEFLAFDYDIPRTQLNEIPKIRLGGDLSYNFGNFSFESEFIKVDINRENINLNADLDFYYATLGYHFTEKLFIYGSYWAMNEHLEVSAPNIEFNDAGDVHVYSLGASYGLTDRIRLKAQASRVTNKDEGIKGRSKFSLLALAVSAFF